MSNVILADSRLVVALDYPSGKEALELVEQLSPKECKLKVGKELFTREGPQFVSILVNQGFDVFLDLKFHDIPNTVGKAIEAAMDLGVWMVNVHACGGARMMEAARKAMDKSTDSGLLIAVTVLTSMDLSELQLTGVSVKSVEQQVQHLTALAFESGVDGVVCSAQESNVVKASTSSNFLSVTPGIRMLNSSLVSDDQKRVVTPKQAIINGSDYLVVGRSITASNDPRLMVRKVNDEISEGQKIKALSV